MQTSCKKAFRLNFILFFNKYLSYLRTELIDFNVEIF